MLVANAERSLRVKTKGVVLSLVAQGSGEFFEFRHAAGGSLAEARK